MYVFIIIIINYYYYYYYFGGGGTNTFFGGVLTYGSTEWAVSKSFRAEHTPSIFFPGTFFQTLPEYVTPTEGALYISAQLSTDADGAPPKRLATNKTADATEHRSKRVNMRRVCPGLKKKKRKKKEEFRPESNDFGFICAGVSNMGDYKGKAWCYKGKAVMKGRPGVIKGRRL